MPVRLVDHPIAHDALVQLRSAATGSASFRALAHRLCLVLAIESTRDLTTAETAVDGPLERAPGRRLAGTVVVVPVLRAGLAMVEPLLTLLPSAEVGHIGLERDEETAIASGYCAKLPAIDETTTVLLADPMLATGGSALAALRLIAATGARHIHLLTVVAAPEGIAAVEQAWPDVIIHTAAVDRQLNARKYILPGLGDFGDRLYGT